jgi:acetyltransferase-like isoleucine patch superfamily enzyme
MAIMALLIGLLPASSAKNRLMRLIVRGWDVDKDAHIGPCLIWRVRELRMGSGASIGAGTVFRDMNTVRLGAESRIGNLDWFSGTASYIHVGGSLAGTLLVEDGAAITSRHYLDCSGGITIGEMSTVAGVRSTILSHSVELGVSEQQTAPVRIGKWCFISTGVVIAPGIVIADRTVVGAGAVVVRDLTESECFYGGVPARRIRSLAGATYFARTEPRILPRGD